MAWIKLKSGWKINTSTLIRFEIRKGIPKLIIHEKFENSIKWILRFIAFVGIATSIITIDKWYFSLLLSIIIFLVEQFFETTTFEFTTFYFSKIPSFNHNSEEWFTNGFLIPVGSHENIAFWGPTFKTKEYAIQVFDYFIDCIGSNQDVDDKIKITLIIDEKFYYTLISYYPDEKKLIAGFNEMENELKYEKKGKIQQKFLGVYLYSKRNLKSENLQYLLNYLNDNPNYIFLPSILENNKPVFLFEHQIKKTKINIKNMNEISRKDKEYHFLKKYIKENYK
jgi:hypothetical protein